MQHVSDGSPQMPAPSADFNNVFSAFFGDRDELYFKYSKLNPENIVDLRDFINSECQEVFRYIGVDRLRKIVPELIHYSEGSQDEMERYWENGMPPFELGRDKSLIFLAMAIEIEAYLKGPPTL